MRSESRLHQLELLISNMFDRPLTEEETLRAQTFANELASRLGLLSVVNGAAKLRRVAELLDGIDSHSTDVGPTPSPARSWPSSWHRSPTRSASTSKMQPPISSC